jgi:hypothetical protein
LWKNTIPDWLMLPAGATMLYSPLSNNNAFLSINQTSQASELELRSDKNVRKYLGIEFEMPSLSSGSA